MPKEKRIEELLAESWFMSYVLKQKRKPKENGLFYAKQKGKEMCFRASFEIEITKA